MLKKWTTFIVIAMGIFFGSFSSIQAMEQKDQFVDKCILPDLHNDQRPGATERPTQVSIGLRLLDITAIEDSSQSITPDFVVSLTWVDPRLMEFEGCQFGLDEVWTPQIDIINAGRLFTRLRKHVDVLASGNVRYVQRYQGSLVFHYDAHQFPFDQQNIIISLLSYTYGEKDLSLVIDEEFTGRKPEQFNIPDWKINKVQAIIMSQSIDAIHLNSSEFSFNISAQRVTNYFIWKVIIPIILIVLMSWTVFWIDPSQLSAQMGMSATSMLTLIAFQFTLADILPRVSYYTLLDRFVIGSTFLVFLSLLESLITSHLAADVQKQKLAIRIDRISRWLFPLVFVIFSVIAFSV